MIFRVYVQILSVLVVATTAARSEEPSCTSNTNSYLWQVDTQPPIYLFGTVHVPYTTLWDHIPDNAKTAFSLSSEVCVELRLSQPTTLSDLTQCQQLPRGAVLSELLSNATRHRIARYLQHIHSILPTWVRQSSSIFGGRQYEAEAMFQRMSSGWEGKRPIWTLFMLSSMTEENIVRRHVPLLDLFLDNAAEGMGKRVQAVESVNDQCRPLNRLKTDQVERALNVLLNYLEPLVSGPGSSIKEDVEVYRCGDFTEIAGGRRLLPIPSGLSNLTEADVLALDEMNRQLEAQLIVRRNRKMTQKLDALIRTERDQHYFIAIGAGHMLGRKSIIARLRNKGHTVRHIPVDATIEGPSLPDNIIELGHPGSKPRLQDPLTLPETTGYATLPTVDPQTLEELWRKYFDVSKRSTRPLPIDQPAVNVISMSTAVSATMTTNNPSRQQKRSDSSQWPTMASAGSQRLSNDARRDSELLYVKARSSLSSSARTVHGFRCYAVSVVALLTAFASFLLPLRQ